MPHLAALILVLALWPTRAEAIPVAYTLEFQVESVSYSSKPIPIGTMYFGFFVVDNAILATDGLNKYAEPSTFYVQMDTSIFDSQSPPGPFNDFEGFLLPVPETGHERGRASPGFDVVGGQVTQISGGVYGPGDSRFIDFGYLYPPNQFGASIDIGFINGRYDVIPVRRVPEPATIFLLGTGLPGILLLRKFSKA